MPLAPKRNGVTIERLSEDGEPYQGYHGDLLACPQCDLVILRLAPEPWTESHKPDYADFHAGAEYTVFG